MEFKLSKKEMIAVCGPVKKWVRHPGDCPSRRYLLGSKKIKGRWLENGIEIIYKLCFSPLECKLYEGRDLSILRTVVVPIPSIL